MPQTMALGRILVFFSVFQFLRIGDVPLVWNLGALELLNTLDNTKTQSL
jgi:hypothetical protein